MCLCLVRSISFNYITAEGAKYFANALVDNQSLTSLKYALACDFSICQQPLTALCLTLVRSVLGNHMGPEGAKAFGEVLKTNSCLRRLKCVPLDH